MELPPLAHAYIVKLYEGLIDKGYNLEQIRIELAKNGVKRTLGQIEYDLDHRYSFYGYAASHRPPPRLTYAQIEKIDKEKASKARVLCRSMSA